MPALTSTMSHHRTVRGLSTQKPVTGQARLVITMGWAWEAAWAAYRRDWPRVALMHEWLGTLPVGFPADAAVNSYPSVAEGYDCLWAETIMRRMLGLSKEVRIDCPASA